MEKTTLLRLLTGLARPDDGEVYWQGEPPCAACATAIIRACCGLGISRTRLTERENLHFFHPGDGVLIPDALEQAGMVGFEDVLIAQLSSGQHRNVTLSRLWLTRAALWVLDEPFTAIDVSSVARLTRRMAEHMAKGGVVILTIHYRCP